MRVTLVFDNIGTQDIDKKHILRLKFEQLKRRLFYKFRFFNPSITYDCSACDMIIGSGADQPTAPNSSANSISSSMTNTTVFENILSNTITAIEVEDKNNKKTIFIPSKIESEGNKLQVLHKDSENNLHIKCRNRSKVLKNKEPT